jgi:hypothetical protein
VANREIADYDILIVTTCIKIAFDTLFHLKKKGLIDQLDGILTIGDLYSRVYQQG